MNKTQHICPIMKADCCMDECMAANQEKYWTQFTVYDMKQVDTTEPKRIFGIFKDTSKPVSTTRYHMVLITTMVHVHLVCKKFGTVLKQWDEYTEEKVVPTWIGKLPSCIYITLEEHEEKKKSCQ